MRNEKNVQEDLRVASDSFSKAQYSLNTMHRALILETDQQEKKIIKNSIKQVKAYLKTLKKTIVRLNKEFEGLLGR